MDLNESMRCFPPSQSSACDHATIKKEVDFLFNCITPKTVRKNIKCAKATRIVPKHQNIAKLRLKQPTEVKRFHQEKRQDLHRDTHL